MISQALEVLKGVVPAIGLALAMYAGIWVKRVFDQKKRNTINEIDLSAKKISLDVHSKPVDDLVADSNSSHGADAVVKDSGDDDKKG